MKKFVYTLIAIMALGMTSVPAYADHHGHGDRPGREQRDNGRGKGHDNDRGKGYKDKKKGDKHHHKGDKYRGPKHDRPQAPWQSHDRRHRQPPRHYRPAPPPPPRHSHMGYGYGYDYKHNKRLHKMIKKYGKGYRDVRVWQLAPDRYVMCYMNAGHYFMRELNTIYNTITSPMRVLLNDGYWTVYGAPHRYYVPNGPSINIQFNL